MRRRGLARFSEFNARPVVALHTRRHQGLPAIRLKFVKETSYTVAKVDGVEM